MKKKLLIASTSILFTLSAFAYEAPRSVLQESVSKVNAAIERLNSDITVRTGYGSEIQTIKTSFFKIVNINVTEENKVFVELVSGKLCREVEFHVTNGPLVGKVATPVNVSPCEN